MTSNTFYNKKNFINNLETIYPESISIFNENFLKLLQIFQFYCSVGDPLNTKKLKSNKLKKLFTDCDLIDVI